MPPRSGDDERSGDGERPVDAHAPTEAVSGDGTHTGPRSKRSPLARPSVGRFRIEAPLGSGGMGDVYRAHDSVLDRAVALKVLRPDDSNDDDAQRRRRVVREARAAAALTHPNTVTIFDVGEDGDEIFIAMELLEGEDLRAKLERGDASLSQKLRWLREAARALAAAHERGLVHRDVKPENMFVCKDGTLKLLDFGIAKRGEDEGSSRSTDDHPVESIGPSSFKTAVGRRFGTPRYMAPEQHAGEATDPRTDQYAWGLVAFELLTGSLAIDSLPTRTSDSELQTGAADVAPARFAELRARVPELPEAIARVVQRALEPKKDARFASMTEIVDALEAIPAEPPSGRTHAPVSAKPEVEPAAAPESKPRRRRWVLAVAAVGVLTALGAGARYWKTRSLPPACRVTNTRSFAFGPKDRFGFDHDGRLMIAREIDKGVRIEREGGPTAGSLTPVKLPQFAAALTDTYDDLAIFGTKIDDVPYDVLIVYQHPTVQAADLGVFVLYTSGDRMMSQRVFGPVTGLSFDRFLGKALIVASADSHTDRAFKLPPAIEAYRPGVLSRPVQVELAHARDVSVGTHEDRIAIAYREGGQIRFVMLDRDLAKVGDNHVVARADAAPRLAFDGRTVAVYWLEEPGGRPRVMTSRLTVGEPSFSPPRPAIDEPISRYSVSRLSGGRHGLVWVTTTGGSSVLKYAPVNAQGKVATPVLVASGRDIPKFAVSYDGQDVPSVAYQDRSETLTVVALECDARADR